MALLMVKIAKQDHTRMLTARMLRSTRQIALRRIRIQQNSVRVGLKIAIDLGCIVNYEIFTSKPLGERHKCSSPIESGKKDKSSPKFSKKSKRITNQEDFLGIRVMGGLLICKHDWVSF